jgi:hypothetical protein
VKARTLRKRTCLGAILDAIGLGDEMAFVATNAAVRVKELQMIPLSKECTRCGVTITGPCIPDICGECAEAESCDRHAAHKNGACGSDCYWCRDRPERD